MKPNQFIHRISKEMVHWMPLVQFTGHVFIVDEAEQVAAATDYLSKQSVLGVDTESRPSFTRGVHYPTALVQIATEERCYLFRLSYIGLPQSLIDIFTNPAICKVGLAFRDDLNGLRRIRNFTPVNCVDIQQLVPLYGIFDLGLQKIYAICFSKKISKSQQLTNWETPILTAEQARYASTDAWATLCIYKELLQTEKLTPDRLEQLRTEDAQKQYLERQHNDNHSITTQ